MTNAIPIPAPECPLCGRPNECGPACSGSFDTPCWCLDARIPAELVDSLPEAVRGRACVCRDCVARHGGSA
ncbi:MAG: cysteine-rich CWC family protein [Azoarcus sp.]|nr:cysteine-rich CWC family protein [Azoarcus sp.]